MEEHQRVHGCSCHHQHQHRLQSGPSLSDDIQMSEKQMCYFFLSHCASLDMIEVLCWLFDELWFHHDRWWWLWCCTGQKVRHRAQSERASERWPGRPARVAEVQRCREASWEKHLGWTGGETQGGLDLACRGLRINRRLSWSFSPPHSPGKSCIFSLIELPLHDNGITRWRDVPGLLFCF